MEGAYVYAFPLVLMDAIMFLLISCTGAIAGLGANTVGVALYPKTEQDIDGNPLTGEKSYVLHFERYPQVLEGGFWSVTAYGDDDFLIDNPIDRYCINDRSGLEVNDDGSVDVILSKDALEDTLNIHKGVRMH